MYFGVALDGTRWNEDFFDPDSNLGFGMHLDIGALYGHGWDGSDVSGQVSEGQVVTIELDTDAHTLKFWVDGKHHGPGFTSIVLGSLRWTLRISAVFDAVQIVPSADVFLEEC